MASSLSTILDTVAKKGASKGMKINGKFDVVAAVKSNSRDMFRDMPKQKRIGDKRFKKPKYPQKFDE